MASWKHVPMDLCHPNQYSLYHPVPPALASQTEEKGDEKSILI